MNVKTLKDYELCNFCRKNPVPRIWCYEILVNGQIVYECVCTSCNSALIARGTAVASYSV